MTEQLYLIESVERYDLKKVMVAYLDGYCAGALIPVPVPRTLAWALGEMYAHPMREYKHGGSYTRWRWNGVLEMCEVDTWTIGCIIRRYDIESTSWSPCEAEEKLEPKRGEEFFAHLQKASETVATWPVWKQEILGGTASKPVPQPGSYAEANAAVRSGKVAIREDGRRYWDYRDIDRTCRTLLDGQECVVSWPEPSSLHKSDWTPCGWGIEEPLKLTLEQRVAALEELHGGGGA